MSLSRAVRALLWSIAVPALATAQQPGERYIETIEVRVADVDVVVTDRAGNPLTDLRREDFKLFENGKPVEIAYFSRIVEGRLEPEEPEEGAPPPSREAAAPARAPLTWGIFIDQTNMRPARRNEGLRRIRAFLETAMGRGDRAILATFDGQAFRIRGGFTNDRTVFLRVLETIENERVSAGPAYTQEIALRAEIQRSTDPIEEGRTLADQIFTLIEWEAARQSNAIAALRGFVDMMAGVEGRQAVLYLGSGYNTLPALGVTEAWRRRFPNLAGALGAPRPEDQQARLENEITELYERVSATRVTFYPVLAGDSGGMPSADDATGIDLGGGDMTAPPAAADRAQLGQEAATRELADRTGGMAFKVGPALDTQLAAVTRDLTHYYSLGYVPEGDPGRPRKLTVEVNVDGARVRYRGTLRERTADEQAHDSVVGALFHPERENPLHISIEVDPPRRAGVGRRLIPVRVKVPLSSLAFLRDGEEYEGGISIHAAILADEGTVWRLESRELPLRISRADMPRAHQQHITYRFEIPVRGERMRLAVSVQDRYSPQIHSTLAVPLETSR